MSELLFINFYIMIYVNIIHVRMNKVIFILYPISTCNTLDYMKIRSK